MEQARLLLAIGLSFLVLFVWSFFFNDQPAVTNQNDTQKHTQQKEVEQAKTAKAIEIINQAQTVVKEGVDDISADGTGDEAEFREITIETPFYKTRISSRGAAFTSYTLKEYREKVEKDSPNKELIPPDFKSGILRTTLLNQSVKGLETANYAIDQTEEQIVVKDTKKKVAFKWVSDDGFALVKTYTFDPKSYLIELNISVINSSTVAIKDQLVLSLRKPVKETKGYGFVGPNAYIDDSLKEIKIKKIEDNDSYSGKIKWIGIEDRYFLTSIVPGTETEGSIKLGLDGDVITNRLINPEFQLASGMKDDFDFFIFMGPKSMELLDSLGHDLGKALNFGFFNVIAKPCLWFMNKIHGVIPNYGIAIILLTIFTKILLWPLGNKSYKSMSEMKKLQPLMAEIREKYKSDKQRMNQELMALYKTYKVNPVGGCLPMVLQIPVFFALYRMLYQAIELRHAPFMLWINDLSAPDRLFDFGFSIPFMEAPYGIPVLTIVMGATMLLQQKMSPPPGDPTQAKMMMMMPIVFTFIFINFSSGLVLYWLINNILSISQQYYVQKKSI